MFWTKLLISDSIHSSGIRTKTMPRIHQHSDSWGYRQARSHRHMGSSVGSVPHLVLLGSAWQLSINRMQDYIYCGMQIPYLTIRATFSKDKGNSSFTFGTVGDHIHYTSLHIICKQIFIRKVVFFNWFKRALLCNMYETWHPGTTVIKVACYILHQDGVHIWGTFQSRDNHAIHPLKSVILALLSQKFKGEVEEASEV